MKASRQRHHGLALAAFLSSFYVQLHAASPLDTNWDNRFGPIGVNGQVNAITQVGTNIYVAGQFTLAGAVGATNIARWDGARWWALGRGLNYAGYALANDGSNVYAGGLFTAAGGVTADRVAKWNGTNWSPLGNPTLGNDGNSVNALLFQNGVLYAAGFCYSLSGVSVTNIAQWNGTSWKIVGGNFISVADTAGISSIIYNNLVRWDGQQWHGFGDGVGGTGGSSLQVAAFKVAGTNVYVGGSLPTVADLNAQNIARWDGTHWNQLGRGLTNSFGQGAVTAIESVAGQIYAGGSFIRAGLVNVTNVARWDGTNWFAAGTLDNQVSGLAAVGTNLYAGGIFVHSGSATVNYIAHFNGANWGPVGGGVTGTGVNVLTPVGTNLCIGGQFRQAGSVSAMNIALWNGATWSALGPGLGQSSDTVQAIAPSPDGQFIYATGDFQSAGSTNWISRWNGQTWTNIGVADAYVDAMAFVGNDLFVGGGFDSINGVAATRIAGWDGTNWFALGDGIPVGLSAVYALGSSGGDLIVGGLFEDAGGQPDERFGIYHTGLVQAQPAAPHLILVPPTPGSGALTISWPDSALGFILESNGNLGNATGWQAFTGTINDTNGQQTTQTSIAPGSSFFRLRHP